MPPTQALSSAARRKPRLSYPVHALGSWAAARHKPWVQQHSTPCPAQALGSAAERKPWAQPPSVGLGLSRPTQALGSRPVQVLSAQTLGVRGL
ncbi:hypothetical protein AMTR_s00058p00076140 [Amborella trichopoda]|uniref:Uncharacterized protein n=1 Tax=Amborella trichopoda TaxID=13333 RepID=W1PEV8_AMBTC|nr:hypothetical protein AMTR_s00058p00076140 [Amborella trichopoda]